MDVILALAPVTDAFRYNLTFSNVLVYDESTVSLITELLSCSYWTSANLTIVIACEGGSRTLPHSNFGHSHYIFVAQNLLLLLSHLQSSWSIHCPALISAFNFTGHYVYPPMSFFHFFKEHLLSVTRSFLTSSAWCIYIKLNISDHHCFV